MGQLKELPSVTNINNKDNIKLFETNTKKLRKGVNVRFLPLGKPKR